MRRVVRRARLPQPPDRVYAACLDLLRTPDPARGVVARRVEPDPPAVDAVVHTTVSDRRGGVRELSAVVAELEPGVSVATVTEGTPAVRIALRCDPAGGGTLLTLTSEAGGALGMFGRLGALLDVLLFASGQRRAARATLRRVAELSARG